MFIGYSPNVLTSQVVSLQKSRTHPLLPKTMIYATAPTYGGIASGKANIHFHSLRPGISVRITIQASETPISTAHMVTAIVNEIVLQSN